MPQRGLPTERQKSRRGDISQLVNPPAMTHTGEISDAPRAFADSVVQHQWMSVNHRDIHHS
jgi:hypothetical protein